MDFPYSINDLSTNCKVSKQSVYKLISKNQPFVKQNSTRKGRSVKYSQAVLDWLLSYYAPEASDSKDMTNAGGTQTSQGPDDTTEGASANNMPPEAPETPLEAAATEIEAKRADEQISALEAKIEALEAQLAQKEAERVELLRQNGNLLLLLTQEKQEKLLLTAPKKPILERVKGLFIKK